MPGLKHTEDTVKVRQLKKIDLRTYGGMYVDLQQ